MKYFALVNPDFKLNNFSVLNLLIFQVSGFTLIFMAIWLLLDPRRNYVLDLVDFSEDDPLLKVTTYVALFTGIVSLLIGFVGCCGAVKRSLYLMISVRFFLFCFVIFNGWKYEKNLSLLFSSFCAC